MVEIDSGGNIASKWSRNASQAQQDFQTGVEDTQTQEQQQATAQATEAWASGVQEAINNGTFERGVNNPVADWQTRTLELGAQRFSSGVQASESAFQQGFEPYRQAIESLSLSARGPRGDVATNIERVRQVAEALNNVRTNQS